MKVSAKTRYGLRAMALLAKNYKEKKFLSLRKFLKKKEYLRIIWKK